MVDVVPLVDEGLGNSAYLVDLGDGRALAVDPTRDLRALRALAERRDCGSRSRRTPICTPTSSPAPWSWPRATARRCSHRRLGTASFGTPHSATATRSTSAG